MIGKWILVFGIVLIVIEATGWLIESLGLTLGRLLGDIRMRGEGWRLKSHQLKERFLAKMLAILLHQLRQFAIV